MTVLPAMYLPSEAVQVLLGFLLLGSIPCAEGFKKNVKWKLCQDNMADLHQSSLDLSKWLPWMSYCNQSSRVWTVWPGSEDICLHHTGCLSCYGVQSGTASFLDQGEARSHGLTQLPVHVSSLDFRNLLLPFCVVSRAIEMCCVLDDCLRFVRFYWWCAPFYRPASFVQSLVKESLSLSFVLCTS